MSYKQEIRRWWRSFERLENLDQKNKAIRAIAKENRDEEFYNELNLLDAVLEDIQTEFEENDGLDGYCAFLGARRQEPLRIEPQRNPQMNCR